MDGVRPSIVEDAAELLSARHPLLGDSAVPIDLRLGDRFGYRALVVTGPNTGGKTVSLKTLGLLSLMHQAGLRVPAADGARLPVFRRVMADIGDEQSIAQSLSTFSSHLRNVVRFVAEAGPATLVLLDEVGAGTDPAEGSALAMAIVSRLLEAGAMVAATTHYAELKTFATEHPGVSNAAVEFDVTTLRPTYRLTIGLPGKSQAFAIAERLGLPRPILADARDRISAEHASMEETLAAIAAAEQAQAAALEAAQAERATAADERELARTGRGEGTPRGGAAPGRCPPHGRRAGRARGARGGRASSRDDPAAQPRRRQARHERLPPFDELSRRPPAPARDGGRLPPDAEPAEEGPQPRVGLFGRSRTLGSTGRIVEISGRTGRVTLETDGARLVVPGRRRRDRARADQRAVATRPRGRGDAPARRPARVTAARPPRRARRGRARAA